MNGFFFVMEKSYFLNNFLFYFTEKLSNTERENDGFLHIYNTPNIIY